VRRTRGLQRRARSRAGLPAVVLVGYTNAGKSTLFNRLTQAGVLAKDMLFATLDPTARQVKLPSGRAVIMSDTVGFISDLPHELVEAFRATLEAVTEADLLVHVRDIAHPQTRQAEGRCAGRAGAIGEGRGRENAAACSRLGIRSICWTMRRANRPPAARGSGGRAGAGRPYPLLRFRRRRGRAWKPCSPRSIARPSQRRA
jgi:hypothetical protein